MNNVVKPILVGVGLGAVLVAVGVLVLMLLAKPDALEAAAEECETAATPLTVQDDGQSLSLSASTAETFEIADCVLDELEVPDSIRSKMSSTTALQGRQSDSWGDYEASWTFHPDNGLDLIIEEK